MGAMEQQTERGRGRGTYGEWEGEKNRRGIHEGMEEGK